MDVKAILVREIHVKQVLHFDVSSPDYEIEMMFYGMGKDIQGMKSPISNEHRNYTRS
ncbi:hypothetical protein [Candidatus Merdisoma sp. JLR.KK006]|uniref:hypothetical protein n=1 Tax=Candidatus Merdisoma sp. JLR.KK006 TaxID=3112626 RepID=UPI002FF00582